MSALELASRTRLDRYFDRIKKLSEEFPRYWWIVGMADIRMRSEQMDRVKRDCLKRYKAGMLPDFDPAKPWDVVFREAAMDHEFWGREVDKKVLQHITSMASPAKLVDEGYGVLEEAPHAVKTSKGGGGAGGGKRRRSSSSSSGASDKKKKKRKSRSGKPFSKPKPDAGKGDKGKKGAGKGAGKPANAQRADGKYTRFNGNQVCFAWNGSVNGCSPICPQGRAHVCEICTERHRTIECTTPKK
jgi:hypothetical protein